MIYTSIEQLVSTLKVQLAKDEAKAVKALVTIYKNQTATEKAAEYVISRNGIGFRQSDAKFLSSLAEKVVKGVRLSEKQMYYVKKCMPVYARQLITQSIREGKIKKEGKYYIW